MIRDLYSCSHFRLEITLMKKDEIPWSYCLRNFTACKQIFDPSMADTLPLLKDLSSENLQVQWSCSADYSEAVFIWWLILGDQVWNTVIVSVMFSFQSLASQSDVDSLPMLNQDLEVCDLPDSDEDVFLCEMRIDSLKPKTVVSIPPFSILIFCLRHPDLLTSVNKSSVLKLWS